MFSTRLTAFTDDELYALDMLLRQACEYGGQHPHVEHFEAIGRRVGRERLQRFLTDLNGMFVDPMLKDL